MSEDEMTWADAMRIAEQNVAHDIEHLVEERRRATRAAQEWAVRAVNAEKALAVARRQVEQWEEDFPCDGGCFQAPEECCSRHGRKPNDLWRIISEEYRKVTAVEALAEEWSESADHGEDERNGRIIAHTLRRCVADIERALASAAAEPVSGSGSEAGR